MSDQPDHPLWWTVSGSVHKGESSGCPLFWILVSLLTWSPHSNSFVFKLGCSNLDNWAACGVKAVRIIRFRGQSLVIHSVPVTSGAFLSRALCCLISISALEEDTAHPHYVCGCHQTWGSGYSPYGWEQAVGERDLHRADLMKSSKDKCKVSHVGWTNSCVLIQGGDWVVATEDKKASGNLTVAFW